MTQNGIQLFNLVDLVVSYTIISFHCLKVQILKKQKQKSPPFQPVQLDRFRPTDCDTESKIKYEPLLKSRDSFRVN